MGRFAHPMHYFAAAGENYDFVIAVINFQLNQYFWKFLWYLFGCWAPKILNMNAYGNEILGYCPKISRFLKYFEKILFGFIFEIWRAENAKK